MLLSASGTLAADICLLLVSWAEGVRSVKCEKGKGKREKKKAAKKKGREARKGGALGKFKCRESLGSLVLASINLT